MNDQENKPTHLKVKIQNNSGSHGVGVRRVHEKHSFLGTSYGLGRCIHNFLSRPDAVGSLRQTVHDLTPGDLN